MNLLFRKIVSSFTANYEIFFSELAICCTDRTIRVYRIEEGGNLVLSHKFQDQVGRTQYTRCIFSNPSDCIVAGKPSLNRHVYLCHKTEHMCFAFVIIHFIDDVSNSLSSSIHIKCGCFIDENKKGSASKSDHHIYIWDKLTGNLNTMLHGPKEGLVDLTVGHFI